jgi:NO-binding membrane sensor protein with MHYT domain
VQGFSVDFPSFAIAFVMSIIGSALGLMCTARARVATGWARARWLVLASLSIGGTGIWVMHFIAMLGSSVDETSLLYNGPRTILSMVMAVVIVAIGLFTVGFKKGTSWLFVGGVFTGTGVVTMHYLGMSAITLHGDVSYDPVIVAASVVIALVAATAALWAALNIKGTWSTALAAVIMGIAVTGMHYTGMAAARVTMHDATGALAGIPARDFLLPMVVGISFITLLTLAVVVLSPNAREMAEEAELQARISRDRANPRLHPR